MESLNHGGLYLKSAFVNSSFVYHLQGNSPYLSCVVYELHSIVTWRTLWNVLLSMASARLSPWILLGDFNNVIFDDERMNGSLVKLYETRDFLNCVLSLGFVDVPSIGCRLTWTNIMMWSKLDKVMVNDAWLQLDLYVHAHFLPSGQESDHSPCVVSIEGQDGGTRSISKFFDMLIDHEIGLEIVQQAWSPPLYGTEHYMCRRLKGLKTPLKGLNQEHYHHISSKVERAREELEKQQQLFHDSPEDGLL